MKFQIFTYKPGDYELLESWWKYKGREAPDPDLLPGLGLIVTGDSVPICAGFLFKTDAKIAILNHVISSPTPMDRDDRSAALDHLICRMIFEARSSGFRILSAACNVDRLGKRYENLGFKKTDSDEVHYGRLL